MFFSLVPPGLCKVRVENDSKCVVSGNSGVSFKGFRAKEGGGGSGKKPTQSLQDLLGENSN